MRRFPVPAHQVSLEYLIVLLVVISLDGHFVDFVLGDVVLLDERVDVSSEFFDEALLVLDVLLHHLVLRLQELAAVLQLFYLSIE